MEAKAEVGMVGVWTVEEASGGGEGRVAATVATEEAMGAAVKAVVEMGATEAVAMVEGSAAAAVEDLEAAAMAVVAVVAMAVAATAGSVAAMAADGGGDGGGGKVVGMEVVEMVAGMEEVGTGRRWWRGNGGGAKAEVGGWR